LVKVSQVFTKVTRMSTTYVCIASGPSLTAADCELVRQSGLPTIAVNNSWQLAPWCDHLYAGDLAWWDANAADVPPGPKRWSCTRQAVAKHGLNYHESYGPYNSGLRAIELAFKLGAERVLLLGYDCTVAAGTHWHGSHLKTKNPDEALCRKWQAQHGRLPQRAQVVNCSRETALTVYRLGMLELELNKVVDTSGNG
jgi:hypothetical protein